MFDSTFTASSVMIHEDQIPFSFAFPYFAELFRASVTPSPEVDGTLDHKPSVKYAQDKLLGQIDDVFSFAWHIYQDIDKHQLQKAYREACYLATSNLFGGKLSPEVTIDPYGECTFYHYSKVGYVDIGVCGEGELSWHVRNDKEPEATDFDDYKWEDFIVPKRLFKALQALRRHL